MYLQEFSDYLRFEKRYSPHTSTAYITDLTQFSDWLQANVHFNDIKEISHLQIRGWIVELVNSGQTARSVNRKITTLKTYYKFLLRNAWVSANPMLKIQSPRQEQKLPVFVEEQKMENLLEDIEFPDNFEGVRDKLLLELFYATGIRVSELVNLKKQDVNLYNLSLTVLGKRNKERSIPIVIGLKNLIENYLDLIKHMDIPDSGHLFCNEKGRKLSPQKVYDIVKHYLSMVTTAGKKSPHVLRHTFATHMLNKGADINAIKEILGHANLAATQIYTHNTIDKLKKSYNLAHPKA